MSLFSGAGKMLPILGLSSAASLTLFAARFISTDERAYSFLVWNLFLAWLPLLFVMMLSSSPKTFDRLNLRAAVLTLLWFIFLPNSFYIASDLVHLQTAENAHLLYDAAMLLSFTLNGLLLGYASLFIMHRHLLKKLPALRAHLTIGLVLLVCSFGIYLGRFLRWNTWDVIFNPSGLIFDVSDRFLNPGSYPQTFSLTLTFFIVLGSMYVVIWNVIGYFQPDAKTGRQKPRGRWIDFKFRR